MSGVLMKRVGSFAALVLWATTGAGVAIDGGQPSAKPNVLLICVDDLRTELGCYGSDLVQSPHMDRLADEGRLFTRHYVAQAACGPSRACLLTGRFHRSWHAWRGNWWKNLPPDRPIALAHMFKLNGYRTIGIGKISHSPSGPTDVAKSVELSHYKWPYGVGNVPDDVAITLRHAYYACTSYTDAQIGKVLTELKRLELDQSTIVVLWSDHGYHLGEHDMFCKSTPYEIAVKSPLIIKVPHMAQPGKPTTGIVETADLYPTLADLCNLTPPDDLQGQSVAATVRDPGAPTKGFARSIEWQPAGTCRTIRTDRWRFKRWTDKTLKETLQVELYDHDVDPNERVNVSADHPEVVAELSAMIEERFPKHMP